MINFKLAYLDLVYHTIRSAEIRYQLLQFTTLIREDNPFKSSTNEKTFITDKGVANVFKACARLIKDAGYDFDKVNFDDKVFEYCAACIFCVERREVFYASPLLPAILQMELGRGKDSIFSDRPYIISGFFEVAKFTKNPSKCINLLTDICLEQKLTTSIYNSLYRILDFDISDYLILKRPTASIINFFKAVRDACLILGAKELNNKVNPYRFPLWFEKEELKGEDIDLYTILKHHIPLNATKRGVGVSSGALLKNLKTTSEKVKIDTCARLVEEGIIKTCEINIYEFLRYFVEVGKLNEDSFDNAIKVLDSYIKGVRGVIVNEDYDKEDKWFMIGIVTFISSYKPGIINDKRVDELRCFLKKVSEENDIYKMESFTRGFYSCTKSFSYGFKVNNIGKDFYELMQSYKVLLGINEE